MGAGGADDGRCGPLEGADSLHVRVLPGAVLDLPLAACWGARSRRPVAPPCVRDGAGARLVRNGRVCRP